MAKLDTTVKVFTSYMVDSPVLNGLVGSHVNLKEKCLVTGFGQVDVSSIIIENNIATITTATNHNFEMNGLTGTVVLIEGVSEPSALNTEWRIKEILSGTSFTTETEGLTDQTATGTITVKRAPAGWSKPFSGTNKAAFLLKSGFLPFYMRIWDDASVPTSANGRWSMIRGYETMTGIDNGEGLFPTTAQSTDGLQNYKSSVADASSRPWWLVADGGLVYYGFASTNVATLYNGFCFGDTGSLLPGDQYCCLLSGNTVNAKTLPGSLNSNNNYSTVVGTPGTTTDGKFYARSYTQLGSSIAASFADNFNQGYMGASGFTYPYPLTQGLLYEGIQVYQSGSILRCRQMPGLYRALHANPFAHLDTIDNLPDFPNKTIMNFNLAHTTASTAQCLIDITGPWIRDR